MQELLGRITALDPSASLGIRVIACFDELMVGQVNLHGLLATAAALAGVPAGVDHAGRVTRVGPDGERLPADRAPHTAPREPIDDGTEVWIERVGDPELNDAIILERLALAVRVRLSGTREGWVARDLPHLIRTESSAEERRESASRLGLSPHGTYRIVSAPLFAQWESHVGWPSDVVPTTHGTLHVLVAPATTTTVAASPCGIGVAAGVDDLPRSFQSALVALRLARPPQEKVICADQFGGLVDLLGDPATLAANPDVKAIDALLEYPWAGGTIEALLATTTARQAARTLGVHHSTVQTRLDTVRTTIGFDPLQGYGRTRLGIAYLSSRLINSRVLDLPVPGDTASIPHEASNQ